MQSVSMLRMSTIILATCVSNSLVVGGVAEADDEPTVRIEQDSDVPVQRTVEDMLLFFPARYPSGDWKPAGLNFQEVWFKSEDQTQLHAWYCAREEPRATILLLHGNAGHLASRSDWLRHLQSGMNVSTLIVDYRGYGRSDGVPTVGGVIADAKAARDKLCELSGLKNSEIILMGESLGGALAIQLAAESTPRALILQSTFSSLRDVADYHYPRLSWLISRSKLNSEDSIRKVHCPVLQSHGTMDQTIPVKLANKLFLATHQPKTFVEIPGRGHNNWITSNYLRQLDAFVDSLTSVK